jgi:hypothetical protein
VRKAAPPLTIPLHPRVTSFTFSASPSVSFAVIKVVDGGVILIAVRLAAKRNNNATAAAIIVVVAVVVAETAGVEYLGITRVTDHGSATVQLNSFYSR